MSSPSPDFYESIVKASNRGELWGIDSFANNTNQLEINFAPSGSNNRWFDKINTINAEDRKLLSNLRSTFDLGTKTIIGRDEDEIIDDLSDLMTEVNED